VVFRKIGLLIFIPLYFLVPVEGERPNREQLIELARTDPAAIADLVLALWDRVVALEAKVAALERNSRNSSKPPSSDSGNFSNPPKPKSGRTKSGRKPGGQAGHRGHTLHQVTEPDKVVEHRFGPGELCPKCGVALMPGDEPAAPDCSCDHFEKRQVFELPAVRIEVTEHQAQKLCCPNCGETLTAPFPEGVTAPVQYGPKLQAAGLYLGGYQLIPYQRLGEIFSDLFGCRLSGGTLANFVRRGGRNAAGPVDMIRKVLGGGDLMHCDETGCRLHGRRHWLHVACTGKLTCYHIDEKRGRQALVNFGLLADFRGRAVHDFYSSYHTFGDCTHVLCNAHLLRELTYLHEELDQPWAGEMIELLLEAKQLRERENRREPGARHVIGRATRQKIRDWYDRLLRQGHAMNPEPEASPPGTRGRRARGKPLNLLKRLEERYGEIMGFFVDKGVPFDNNQAERDLRMMKVREKISGTFRSSTNATAFCDLRSIISTARKQSHNIIGCLTELVCSPENLGKTLVGPPLGPE
jgi:transposase